MTDESMTTEPWPARGTCPRCGSGEVTHIVLGMPLEDDLLTAPEWVELAGCIFDSAEDRACQTCGHRWETPE